MHRHLALLGAAAWLVLAGAGLAAGSQEKEGKSVFEARCASCHTVGGGKKVGPDLQGVATRLGGAAKVRAFVADPQGVRPGTPMPNLGLSAAELDAVVAFLAGGAAPSALQPKPQPQAAPKPPPTPAAAGDAARGKRLFEGSDRFEKGGPPCLSCHTIAGIGSLGGGALGPDLTKAWDKYGGAAGVASVLKGLAFPTMAPIFRTRPLTAAEQADVAAFLEDASASRRPGDAVWKLVLLGLAGVFVAIALAFVIWPRRGLAVRRALVRRPTTGAR